MTVEVIPASLLKPLPEALFPRHANSEEHIACLVEALRRGEQLPPIIVDGHDRIVDGFHRWKARIAVDGPHAAIPCVRRRFTSDKELFLAALQENAKHGLRFSEADRVKCAAIEAHFEAGPEASPDPTIRGIKRAVSIDKAPAGADGRRLGPMTRAGESATILLSLLGTGRLQQNRVALEGDLGKLLTAIEDYLARGDDEWESDLGETDNARLSLKGGPSP